jgi:phosphopantetheinyl transferase
MIKIEYINIKKIDNKQLNKIDSKFIPIINKFNVSDDKKRALASYYFKTYLIKKYKLKVGDLININNGKKPAFKNNKIFFSITHSGDYCLIAYANKSIGIDIQYKKDKTINIKQISKHIFNKVEKVTANNFYLF